MEKINMGDRRSTGNKSGKQKNSNVLKYRRPVKIRPGLILACLFGIYLTVSMIVFMFRDKISFYEVVYGKNAAAVNKTYRTLILRNEHVVNTDKAGYINYYVRESGRVAVNSYVYSIDEKGTILSMLENMENAAPILNDRDVSKISKLISDYSISYDNNAFYEVYNFSASVGSIVGEYINLHMLEKLAEMNPGESGELFSMYKTESSGVVAFYTDGYENFDIGTISASDFETGGYNKKIIKSNDILSAGSPAYKIVNDEDWSLIIPLDDNLYEKYKNVSKISIKFDDREIYHTGSFSVITGSDGYYGKIGLKKYMSAYISERYADIKIIEEQVSGLKIPKSSVVEKEFYIIPVSFMGKGGDSTSTGFFKEVFAEDGTPEIQFVSPSIYSVTDEYCYLSTSDFRPGDRIVMNDSSSRHEIGAKGTLRGVYNINNGYCLFRLIEILGESSDYYIVNDSTPYGLVVYDHIVLDGSMVEEDRIVFR